MREDYQRVYAEVNLDTIRSNMEHMKENLSPSTQMIAVIKADGYGHGAIPIAHELENLDYLYGFAVATAEEAFQLRRDNIRKPILILGYTFPSAYEQLVLQDIRMSVFRYDTLTEITKAVCRLREKGIEAKAKIHIKVDTGMSRIGIKPDAEGVAFVKTAFASEGLEVEGIFTHFARADEADKTFAKGQLDTFRMFLEKIKEQTGKEIAVKHCANSAAILELPDANMDVVRAGISLYGLWPSSQVRKDIVSLKPVLSLYSTIIFVKEIDAGTAVSYGGTYTAATRMRIATIPIGYGDGYPRELSNKGYVLIHGKKAPILGRICMDQFMVDVTAIPEAKQGDRVTLIGCDKEEGISIEQLEELSGRFHYELACNLGKRIPRIYTKGGEIISVKDDYQDF